MEDSIPFVSLTDFEEEEVKEMDSMSNLLKLAILSCKEDEIRRSYIKKHMLALETKKTKKKPLPFNLNLKPRTYRRPRSTPIDMRNLLPYLHKIRKSSQLDIQDSQELGTSSSFSQSSRELIRLPNLNQTRKSSQDSQELGTSSSFSQSSRELIRLPNLNQTSKSSQDSQELGTSSSRKLIRLPNLNQTSKSSQESQELGTSSSFSQSSRKLIRLPNLNQTSKSSQGSQELGTSSSFSQSSRKLIRLPNLNQTRKSSQDSQELGSSSSSQSSKKLKFTIRVKPPPPEPELPLDFKKKVAELGGSDPELVFVKTLFTCDVISSKSRLTMPYKQCRVDLGDVNNKPVKVIYRPDDKVREMWMNLNKWDTVSSYVFNSSWNKLVNLNDLKVNNVVQVWCFRVKGEMSFALVKL